MCISKFRDSKCKKMNRNGLGGAIGEVLARAKKENRLVCDLMPAITYLGKTPDDALMCVLPETRPGDAATHMQTVLLQAFCYENFIPVIKVDSSEKLAELCGISGCIFKTKMPQCRCVVVTRDLTIPWDTNYDPPLTPEEQQLTDFYQCTLEESPTPIIALPR